jgi:hypothetical protein
MFVLLRRNRPAWFQDENGSAGRGLYSQGRVIGQDLYQLIEETLLRSAEADPENEPRRAVSVDVLWAVLDAGISVRRYSTFVRPLE